MVVSDCGAKVRVHIKMGNAVYTYHEKSHESLLQPEIYTHKILSIDVILHTAKFPFWMQIFNNLTNEASEESELILICSSIFQTQGPLYFKFIFPRLVFTGEIQIYSFCLVL